MESLREGLGLETNITSQVVTTEQSEDKGGDLRSSRP